MSSSYYLCGILHVHLPTSQKLGRLSTLNCMRVFVVQWTGVTSSMYNHIIHSVPGTDSGNLLNCIILTPDIQTSHVFLILLLLLLIIQNVWKMRIDKLNILRVTKETY